MPASCPRCGTETGEATRFCPNCGLELEVRSGDTAVEQLPPDETGQVPVSVVRAEPGLVRALTTAVRTIRESALGREAGRAADRALAGVDVALASLSARSRAQRELLGLRRTLRSSLQRRDLLLRDLGDAVYRGDEGATDNLRAEIGALDETMEETRGEMRAILEQAEASVRKTQLEVQPTQIQAPETPDVPEPYPPPGEVDPPQQPEIPEPYPPPGELDPPVPPDVPEPSPEPDTTQ
jgi:zinc ribbon protein